MSKGPVELHSGRSRELKILQASLHIEGRSYAVQIALPLGALAGLMLNLQAVTHGFKVIGDVGSAAIQDEGLGDAIAQTRRFSPPPREHTFRSLPAPPMAQHT